MTVYYIDPEGIEPTKAGTLLQPWNTYASLPALSPGDRVLQKQGTVFSGVVTAQQSGTAAAPIVFGVYAPGGTEITNQIGAATLAGVGSAADNFSSGTVGYVWIRCFNITNVTAARYGITLGASATTSGCRASYCRVNGQLSSTAAIQVRTNPSVDPHVVEFCEANSNTYGLLFQGGTTGGAVDFHDNVFQRNSESGIRLAISTAGAVTGKINNNDCRYNGTVAAVEGKGIGIDILSDGTSLQVVGNNCNDNFTIGIRGGSFSGLVNATQILRNDCNRNGAFGIQMGRGAGFIVSRNSCNYNGANRGSFYGRGIECFSSNNSFPCGPGVISYNTCIGNLNFGGTLNNGTEGVGIGLDDNHYGLIVKGNVLALNEGSGIQSNPSGALGTSYIVSNLLVDNFNVPVSRVAAGSWVALVCSQIYTSTTEANLKLLGNTFINSGVPSLLYEISEGVSAAASGVAVQNNLFVGAKVALKARTSITRTNNAYWSCAVNGQSNTSNTLLSVDASAVTSDPKLGSDYRPLPGSPLTGAGAHLGYGSLQRDADGKQRQNPPTIGAYDVASIRTIVS